MRVQHVLSVIAACFESIFGGMIIGWPLLTFVLKSEGYYSYLCQDEDLNNTANSAVNITNNVTTTAITCTSQDEIFSLIYSVIVGVMLGGSFLNGIMFNKLGTWISRAIGIVLYTTGCLVVTFSSSENSWTIFLGALLLAAGGSYYYISSIQYASLFPKIKSTLVSVFTGVFLSSAMTFWVVLQAHRNGISLHSVFLAFSFVGIPSVFITLFLTPRMHIPTSPDKNYSYGILDMCSKRKVKKLEAEEVGLTGNTKEVVTVPTDTGPSVLSCIRTSFFLSTSVQLFSLHIRNIFFIGTFAPWIESITSTDDELDTYTDVFAVFLFLSGPASPIIGVTTDALTARFRNSEANDNAARLKAYAISGFLVSTVGILFSICITIPNLPLQFFSYFLFTLFRSSIYSYACICLAGKFPARHFGTLFGIIGLVNAGLTFLTEPMLKWTNDTFDGDFFVINVILSAVTCISFIHPIFLLFQYRKVTKIIA